MVVENLPGMLIDCDKYDGQQLKVGTMGSWRAGLALIDNVMHSTR